MKRLLLSSLVTVAAVTLAHAADGALLNGAWKIHRSAAGNESDQTCTFTQTDTVLAGTCSASQGEVKLSGKVDGKKVSWTLKTDRDGAALTIIYKGYLDSATKMTGSVTAVEYGIDGEFVATPVQ